MSFLASKLRYAANRFRNRTAFVHNDKETRYGEFYSRVVKLSNALDGLGLNKGDRVAVLLPNCVPAVEIDASCVRRGIVRVPLNARLSPTELLGMLEDSDSHSLITNTKYLQAFEAEGIDLQAKLPNLKHIHATDGEGELSYEALLATGSDDDTFIDVDPDHIFGLFYTGGTSGVLKAAMLTHKNWKTMTRHAANGQPAQNAINAFVAPITHAAGSGILPSLLGGGKSILLNGFEPEELLQTIQDHKVTNVLMVPTMINMLMALPNAKDYDLSSLHTIVYGTAPFAPDRISGAVELLGPVLRQGYGQTESCGLISTLQKEDHLGLDDPKRYGRLSSAGVPAFDVEVRIVDDKGNELPQGEVGEIAIRGDNVMAGYWRAPELTAETLVDGWLYTRDMGRFDEDGYLYLVDRKSDMIISGGYNIYPKEVENAISSHAAVFEVAVVGVPDETWGESVKAVVALKPGESASEEDIIEHVKKTLGSMKKPKSVDFVDELPKSAVGKILRRKVKEPYWEGRDRGVN